MAVEPEESPLLSKGYAGPHGIQGIGANFVPRLLDRNIYDQVVTVRTEDAIQTGKMMAKREGILVGISSGAALCAALRLAREEKNEGKTIVVILPDSGDRYYSTALFQE